MARRRPTAFDVSFPGESNGDTTPSSFAMESRSTSVTSVSSTLGKRRSDRSDAPEDTRPTKRLELPKDAYYTKRRNEIIEDENLVISGEDPPEPDSDSETEPGHPQDGTEPTKPIRELDDFSIFDPKHRNELVTLEALEQTDGVDRSFEAAGKVMPHYSINEDAGQEEQAEAEPVQYVRLSAILRCTVDYTEEEPFYIETQYAWYILRNPSKAYSKFYEHFYTPRRIAQIIISRAVKKPKLDMEGFLERFTKQVDMFGRTYVKQHIWDSIYHIGDVLHNEIDDKAVLKVPLIRTILQRLPQTPESQRPPRAPSGPRIKRMPKNRALLGNIDIAVLKNENQNTTCVTPRIAKLARGLVREELIVLGPQPPPVNKAEVKAAKVKALANLKRLLAETKKKKKHIDYRKDDKVSVRSDPALYTAVDIEHKNYKIGDVVIFPNPDVMFEMEKHNLVPDLDSRVDHFFWFGRIIYIMIESQEVHIQWFNHGSQMIMKEVAHPQELFLADLCGHESLHNIVGKVTVHFGQGNMPSKDKPEEYFCKFMHDVKTGVFIDIDTVRLELCENEKPPNNCPVCPLLEERDQLLEPHELKEDGVRNGVKFAGICYHLEDFVLYRAVKGPANVGYITQIIFTTKKMVKVTMKKVGRIADLEGIFPPGTMKDERQLFLTEELITVDVKELLKIIYVPSIQSLGGQGPVLEDWLDLSYDHFYLVYTFPRLKVKSWDEKRKVKWERLEVCTPCCKGVLRKRKNMQQFFNEAHVEPLATLDLFGGVGAFSRGLTEGSGGCLKVTHAIEIGPSAAKTFARNSPDTVVYNQCANEILRYAVKSQLGHEIEVPKHKYDDKTSIEEPPKPGEIQVITAGFPCQTHSRMNMFVNPDNVKTNLIFTTLSYLDYYSPKFAFFENVDGFLSFSLKATEEDDNEHSVSGPIPMGGLKLVIRSLIDMNYQVRFGLLQAAHYGTPQRRVRFFLVAAKHGEVLPELPQPTHDFPAAKSLSIKYDVKQDPISPIRMAHGIAHHPCVTIEDAINDLPRFDWKHPRPRAEKPDVQRMRRKRELKIPVVECKPTNPYSGFSGKIGYFMPPNTRYQQRARLKETTNIQHFTKPVLPKKVERVLNIPLVAGADYTSLPADMHQFQTADPTSAAGKSNYGKGLYGRLDKDGVFPTTVTNVDPAAKQSRVLHPWCHRIVTVRELARSQGFPDDFVFESLGQNVVTIHRQIGNAVPLPVAHALGREFRESLFSLWNKKRENMIIIDDDDDDDDLSGSQDDQHQLVANGPLGQNVDSDDSDDMYMD